MRRPQISVVIPAYIQNDDQAAWLIEAIQSVYAQSFDDWEIVIVDDCSPLPVTMSGDDLMLLQHDIRRGAGAARNTGIAASTAPYILCLDADDRLKPNALQMLYDMRCPQGVVYGDLEYFGDRTGVHNLPEWSLGILLRGTSPLAVTALMPREAWREVGGFDEQLPGMEDVDFWIRLAERGVCGLRIPSVTFEYRRHAASRQAGIEADNRAKMQQIVDIIKQRHRKVASEMATIEAKCATCPGKGGQGTGVATAIPQGVDPNNTIRIRYVGRMNGSFLIHGFGSGAKYTVSGRGDTLIVDVRDADNFMNRATGGRPDFEKIENVIQPVPVVAAPKAQDNPAVTLPVITSMNVKDAQQLIEYTRDIPDVAVWLAEERAQESPRKTIVTALEKRIGELRSA
jgi:GT2 family glycosyltransferase